MEVSWKRRVFLWLRALCGVALLVWVLRRVRLEEAMASWHDLDYAWVAAALVLGGLSVVGCAVRWMLFLRVYRLHVPFRELLRLTFYADFFNLYFLGALGADGLRLLMLTRQFPGRTGAIVGSLVMDHIGGLFGAVVFYALFTRMGGVISPGAVAVMNPIVVGVVVITFLGLGVIMEPPLQRRIRGLPIMGRLMRPVEPLYAGSWRHPWLFAGFAASWVSFGLAYGAYWAAARALHCPLELPQVLAIMPLVDLAVAVPITVSGLGVRENMFVELAGRLPGIGQGAALATSLLGFAALGTWGLLGGLGLLWDRRRKASPAPDQTSA